MKKQQWPLKTQADFFELLGQLIANGYALERTLMTVQGVLPKQRLALIAIVAGLHQGQPLHQLLAPYVRREIARELAFASVHGRLSQLVMEIGRREHRRLRQSQKLRQLLLYPVVLLVMLAGLMGLFCTYLLPQLQQMGAPVPQLSHWGVVLSVSVLTCCVVSWLGGRIWRRRNWLQRLQLLQRVPFIGSLVQLSIGYQMSLQLGLLLTSGIGLATIVKRSATADSPELMRLLGTQAERGLREGQDLRQVIQSMPLLPPECQHLFAKGKSEQAIGEDFQILAQRKFELLERQVQRYLMIIQPVCFAVIGLIVIGLYGIMLLPMYRNMGELMTW